MAAMAGRAAASAMWTLLDHAGNSTTAQRIQLIDRYVQLSPWLTVANKLLELMGRHMSELGLTPVARICCAQLGSGGVAEIGERAGL